MPKKGTQKQEQNQFYPYIAETANIYVTKGFDKANEALSKRQESQKTKKDIMVNYAIALAAEKMAQLYGYGPVETNIHENIEMFNNEAAGRRDQILNSIEFKTVCENLTVEELRDLAAPKDDKEKAASIETFKQRYDKQVEKNAPEIMARKESARMEDLLSDLRQSTQKSFVGKLKSFFVGNSAQYKSAYSAMERISRQSDMTPEARANAKQAIKNYLDLRGKKVRDHQYGRDRFDAFMKGMSMLMEPQEFVDYCKDLDAQRGQLDKGYKGHIDPEAYMTPEAKEKRAAEQERKAREAEERRAQETVHRVPYDQQMLANNAERDGAISEAHACVDFLRNVRGEPSEKNRTWVEEQMLAHPEARELARKVVQKRGLDIEIPETAVDKLDAKSQKLLKEQEKKMLDFDRKVHPDLYPAQEKEKGPTMQL